MTCKTPPETQWNLWFDAQQRAASLSAMGELSTACAEVDAFLSGNPDLEIRRRALGFRGDLREEAGDTDGARSDFLAAMELSDQPDYERYTLELALGALATRLRVREEAISWYSKALETASANPSVSGASALRRFLQVRYAERFTETEERLIWKVVRQAWMVHGLDGEPDMANLEQTMEKLKNAQRVGYSQ